jgi:DNA invertase Pin-like site-specific DNA recombinase
MWGRGDEPAVTVASYMKYFAYCRKSSEEKERQALSIPAQIDEIRRAFDGSLEVEIVEWFSEEMSAKAPGRPVYADMIRRIERGEANGIVAWHPDRLARNSVDGGWLIHLLDRRVLKDLKFVQYTYEHSAQGMFMLQIMFGQSKYYIDNLSVNVKRGMRKKLEMGWLPNLAPLGYRNDRESSTIALDPERFALLRRMWELLLTGAYGVRQINALANDEWGLRTPRRKRSGGRPISLSATYRMFKNPFYAGVLNWYGEWRAGRHQPMVTLAEFQRAQQLLGRKLYAKPQKNMFAYAGLIRCACGLTITAERKTKPSGRTYVYYHCTRRAYPRCIEPAVRVEDLEHYIAAFLRRLVLPVYTHSILTKSWEDARHDLKATRERAKASAQAALQQTRTQLRTLTDLRVRNLLSDEEYVDRRNVLLLEELRLQEAVRSRETHPDAGFELAALLNQFRKYAADWFWAARDEDKRLIFQSTCSNPVLTAGILNIEATFPFKTLDNPTDFPSWRAIVEELGTHDREELEFITVTIRYLVAVDAARQVNEPPPPVPELLRDRPTRAPGGRASWRPARTAERGVV